MDALVIVVYLFHHFFAITHNSNILAVAESRRSSRIERHVRTVMAANRVSFDRRAIGEGVSVNDSSVVVVDVYRFLLDALVLVDLVVWMALDQRHGVSAWRLVSRLGFRLRVWLCWRVGGCGWYVCRGCLLLAILRRLVASYS